MLALTGLDNHRQQIEALVERWLVERQSLIVQMIELGGAAPASPARLQEFCAILMDYVSAGHFEIFDELVDEFEKRGSARLAESQALLRRLQPTTDTVIRFNDLCDDAGEMPDNLPHELSRLGLALESRFEIEDRLIGLLRDDGDRSKPDDRRQA